MSDGTITFLGHACVRLTLPDERVLFIDPWLADNPSCPESEKRAQRCDYVVATHAHFDHVGAIPELARRFKPKVIAMYELAALLEKHAPGGHYLAMGLGGTQEVDGIRFSLTRAYHSSSFQAPDGLHYAGMPAGVVVQVPGLPTVYHAGDTEVYSDMQLIAELYAPRIAMLPIGDHFTMGPRGAALAARYLKAETIIPLHHSTFPLLTGTVQAFKQELGDLAGRVVELHPGGTIAWGT